MTGIKDSSVSFFIKPGKDGDVLIIADPDKAGAGINDGGADWLIDGMESFAPVVVGIDSYTLNVDGVAVSGTASVNGGDLRVTTAAVELGARSGMVPLKRYAFIHYFEYSPEVAFHGTEAVRIHPVSSCHQQDFAMDTSASGRLLYERGGEKLSADFNSLESPQSILSTASISASEDAEMVSLSLTEAGSSPDGNIYAGFSVPDGAEKVRFYLTYTVTELNGMQWAASNMGFTLVHQRKIANTTGKTAYNIIKYGNRMSPAFDWLTGSMLLWSDDLRVEM